MAFMFTNVVTYCTKYNTLLAAHMMRVTLLASVGMQVDQTPLRTHLNLALQSKDCSKAARICDMLLGMHLLCEVSRMPNNIALLCAAVFVLPSSSVFCSCSLWDTSHAKVAQSSCVCFALVMT